MILQLHRELLLCMSKNEKFFAIVVLNLRDASAKRFATSF